ncbi:copper chaperone PCu(A)C [Agarivorans sp. QJM3NY_29]|uniref:copper chaperone PCu(A)C n=1 Tax=unclassified Agarivorans TaxID=2636026 RepID=UPI003D7D1FE0
MRPLLILLSFILSTQLAFAADTLEVSEPYARATPPNAPTSAIFLSMHNTSEQAISLISASTPAAGRVELHTMLMDGDIMQMRQVRQIEVPAKGTVELKPGGFHLMLFDLQKAFIEGEQLQLYLNFSDGSQQHLNVPVKNVMAMMKMKQ